MNGISSIGVLCAGIMRGKSDSVYKLLLSTMCTSGDSDPSPVSVFVTCNLAMSLSNDFNFVSISLKIVDFQN